MTTTWGRDEAYFLARLIRANIRPGWDELSTVEALLTLVHRDLADVAHAAIRTAQDPTMLTPQSLKFVDSPHWRPTKPTGDTHPRPVQTDDEIKARTQAIKQCPWCDDHGYGPGGLCPHENPEERAARVKGYADEARRQLAKATKGKP